jgi:hypothetical protein
MAIAMFGRPLKRPLLRSVQGYLSRPLLRRRMAALSNLAQKWPAGTEIRVPRSSDIPKSDNPRRRPMGRGLLLWLIGIPLPIILIIWLFGGLS